MATARPSEVPISRPQPTPQSAQGAFCQRTADCLPGAAGAEAEISSGTRAVAAVAADTAAARLRNVLRSTRSMRSRRSVEGWQSAPARSGDSRPNGAPESGLRRNYSQGGWKECRRECEGLLTVVSCVTADD